jgi:hypothetical protein
VLFGSVAALFSCSPYWHIQKACKKQPDLCSTDTVVHTVVHEKPTLDTVFVPKPDTTYIIMNRDSVIIRYSVRRDTVTIEAECPPNETEYIEVPKLIPVEQPKKWHDKVTWWAWALSGMGVGLIALVIVILKK